MTADLFITKAKLDKTVFEYPQDEYTIRSDFTFRSPPHGSRARAELPRLLLEYVGQYINTTFQFIEGVKIILSLSYLLPILTHLKPDGTVFSVPEGPALTRYLGRLFGLVGETLEEDAIMDACFQCAMDNIFNCMLTEVRLKPDPKNKGTLMPPLRSLSISLMALSGISSRTAPMDIFWARRQHTPSSPGLTGWTTSTPYPEQMSALVSETARPGVYKLYKRLDINPRNSIRILLQDAGADVQAECAARAYRGKGRYIEFVVNEQERQDSRSIAIPPEM
ncbi:hypothetical protein BGZ65_009064 [Modicella reniformis]|uniref:Uncharacterized protein n=1 Tax=Modicella reniformis TaxID=1440133 RepID=A0A9P6LSY8_9FUNG|nr:hypothetical protein BGZ65_009064 [Modicella reniformis]